MWLVQGFLGLCLVLHANAGIQLHHQGQPFFEENAPSFLADWTIDQDPCLELMEHDTSTIDFDAASARRENGIWRVTLPLKSGESIERSCGPWTPKGLVEIDQHPFILMSSEEGYERYFDPWLCASISRDTIHLYFHEDVDIEASIFPKRLPFSDSAFDDSLFHVTDTRPLGPSTAYFKPDWQRFTDPKGKLAAATPKAVGLGSSQLGGEGIELKGPSIDPFSLYQLPPLESWKYSTPPKNPDYFFQGQVPLVLDIIVQEEALGAAFYLYDNQTDSFLAIDANNFNHDYILVDFFKSYDWEESHTFIFQGDDDFKLETLRLGSAIELTDERWGETTLYPDNLNPGSLGIGLARLPNHGFSITLQATPIRDDDNGDTNTYERSDATFAIYPQFGADEDWQLSAESYSNSEDSDWTNVRSSSVSISKKNGIELTGPYGDYHFEYSFEFRKDKDLTETCAHLEDEDEEDFDRDQYPPCCEEHGFSQTRELTGSFNGLDYEEYSHESEEWDEDCTCDGLIGISDDHRDMSLAQLEESKDKCIWRLPLKEDRFIERDCSQIKPRAFTQLNGKKLLVAEKDGRIGISDYFLCTWAPLNTKLQLVTNDEEGLPLKSMVLSETFELWGSLAPQVPQVYSSSPWYDLSSDEAQEKLEQALTTQKSGQSIIEKGKMRFESKGFQTLEIKALPYKGDLSCTSKSTAKILFTGDFPAAIDWHYDEAIILELLIWHPYRDCLVAIDLLHPQTDSSLGEFDLLVEGARDHTIFFQADEDWPLESLTFDDKGLVFWDDRRGNHRLKLPSIETLSKAELSLESIVEGGIKISLEIEGLNPKKGQQLYLNQEQVLYPGERLGEQKKWLLVYESINEDQQREREEDPIYSYQRDHSSALANGYLGALEAYEEHTDIVETRAKPDCHKPQNACKTSKESSSHTAQINGIEINIPSDE